jgi:hypothetical protein
MIDIFYRKVVLVHQVQGDYTEVLYIFLVNVYKDIDRDWSDPAREKLDTWNGDPKSNYPLKESLFVSDEVFLIICLTDASEIKNDKLDSFTSYA